LGGTTPATPASFISAIWDYPSDESTALVVSFGAYGSALPSTEPDGTTCNSPTALHTKVGWDNVTGVGTPNGKAFADAFKPAAAAEAGAAQTSASAARRGGGGFVFIAFSDERALFDLPSSIIAGPT
jgi:hypothetical protein